jgi:hypothetical protein
VGHGDICGGWRGRSEVLALLRGHIGCMASTERHRWARVPPRMAWKRPGLPTDWVRVLERHPEGAEAMPGYLWLDIPGKVRRVEEHELELTDDPTG